MKACAKETYSIPSVILMLTFGCGAPENQSLILEEPSAHAWKVFREITWPIDSSGRTEWETWPLATSTFISGESPPSYEMAVGDDRRRHLSSGLLKELRKYRRYSVPDSLGAPDPHVVVGVMVNPDDGFEIRINPNLFKEIIEQSLYSFDGIKKRWEIQKPVEFSDSAIAIKALWVDIDVEDTSKFHHAIFEMPGAAQTQKPYDRYRAWGLAAVHIATGELPDWFWATFIHRGVLEKVQTPGPPYSLSDYECAPEDLEGTVWTNYVLLGTQVSYKTSSGYPTWLSNPKLESNIKPTSSSCMTCHFRAAIGRPIKGIDTVLFLPDDRVEGTAGSLGEGYIGLPTQKWFDHPDGPFVRTDFLWSIVTQTNRVGKEASMPK